LVGIRLGIGPVLAQAFRAVRQDDSRTHVHRIRPKIRSTANRNVASTVQSLVHASTAADREDQAGREQAPGVRRLGRRRGTGSRAIPFGGGPGPYTALLDDDPRASNYRRACAPKSIPLGPWLSPQSASLEGKAGMGDHFVRHPRRWQIDNVRIARPSGVPEFDENVRRAVLAAAPFRSVSTDDPRPSMRWSITFDVKNPVVR